MPLITTGEAPISEAEDGVGVAMRTSRGARVWVIATGACLHDIDRSALPDQFAGADVFTRNRKLIEGAASAKFDVEGALPVEGMQDGAPILILEARDIPTIERHP
jgi:hypothetical protein